MNITIICIEDKNIKKIKKYLRKRSRKGQGGATLIDIALDCDIRYDTARDTVEFMFSAGDVFKVQYYGEYCERYVG